MDKILENLRIVGDAYKNMQSQIEQLATLKFKDSLNQLVYEEVLKDFKEVLKTLDEKKGK